MQDRTVGPSLSHGLHDKPQLAPHTEAGPQFSAGSEVMHAQQASSAQALFMHVVYCVCVVYVQCLRACVCACVQYGSMIDINIVSLSCTLLLPSAKL